MRRNLQFCTIFHEALKPMDTEQFERITTAIAKYALRGTYPELDGLEKSIFILIKPQLDAYNRRYKKGVAR